MTSDNEKKDYTAGVGGGIVSLAIMIIFIIATNNISSTAATTCNITAQRNFAESHWILDAISIGLLILSAIFVLCKETFFYAAQFVILFATRTASLVLIFNLRNDDETVVHFKLHRCPGQDDILVQAQDVCIYILQVVAFIWIGVLSGICLILLCMCCCIGSEAVLEKCKNCFSTDHTAEEHTGHTERKIRFVSNTTGADPGVDSGVYTLGNLKWNIFYKKIFKEIMIF